jgi:hypothetical protein
MQLPVRAQETQPPVRGDKHPRTTTPNPKQREPTEAGERDHLLWMTMRRHRRDSPPACPRWQQQRWWQLQFLLSSSRYPSVARPLHHYFVPFATDPLPLLNMLGLLRSLFVGTWKNSLASQSKANSLDMLGLLRWGLRCAFFVNLLFIFFFCLFQLESI